MKLNPSGPVPFEGLKRFGATRCRIGFDQPKAGAITNPLQNPLRWQREHKSAWVCISLLGAVAGPMLEFIRSPFFSLDVGSGFVKWLSFPEAYWQWALWGFLITAALFYVAQLFRHSN